MIGALVGSQDHCENVGHAWCCEFRQTNCVGSTWRSLYLSGIPRVEAPIQAISYKTLR